MGESHPAEQLHEKPTRPGEYGWIPRKEMWQNWVVCCSCQVGPNIIQEKQYRFSPTFWKLLPASSQKKNDTQYPSISLCSVPCGWPKQQAIHHLTKWAGGALTKAVSAWKRKHGNSWRSLVEIGDLGCFLRKFLFYPPWHQHLAYVLEKSLVTCVYGFWMFLDLQIGRHVVVAGLRTMFQSM